MDSGNSKQFIIFSMATALFCTGGVVLIMLGFNHYDEVHSFVERAKVAEGKVVAIEAVRNHDYEGGSDHYATILYQTATGEDIQFRGPSVDGLLQRLSVNDQVRVFYDVADPSGARVDSFLGLWFSATMFWIVGAGGIVVPLLTLWQAWRWTKAQAATA